LILLVFNAAIYFHDSNKGQKIASQFYMMYIEKQMK
jgi:hypothetical protein